MEGKNKGGIPMALEIVLRENDLRDMPPDLREKLLKWYFEHEGSASGPIHSTTTPVSPAEPVSISLQREQGGRVSFSEFVRAGLIAPGTELQCKALKRQKRSGTDTYIEAGKVLSDGSVEYRGRHYVIPSKLAVDVVNTNGDNTKALNGYDYLFIRVSNRLVPLKDLRDRFPKQNPS
jgi:hypothetical protein